MLRTGMGVALVTAVAVVVTGCGAEGPPLGKVSGTVQYEGAPLADARVVFRPEQGRTSVGTTDADGVYTLEFTPGRGGALLGEHVVSITWENPNAPEPDQVAAGRSAEKPTVILPPAYNTRSTLRATVVAGENRFDFTLDKQGT